ncbi:hypothetical protein CIC12_23770 [Burkholderia sp. SG-MS1]|nr:hypothetical protein [Paraburkholderia sp. SG-MS1]
MKILELLAGVDPCGGVPVEGVRRSGIAMRDAGHVLEVANCDAPDDGCVRAFPVSVSHLRMDRRPLRLLRAARAVNHRRRETLRRGHRPSAVAMR